jgi:multidrug efflux pump subunit AcrA (membrane-fusion protein)
MVDKMKSRLTGKKQTIIKAGSVVLIIAFGFLGMNLLSSTEKHSNAANFKPEIRTVNTQQVTFGDHTLEIEGNGVIESQQTLNIISEANGIVLFAKNNLKDGTFVEKGELILEIDQREVENNLYSLRSAFLNAVVTILPELKIENQETYNKWYNYFESVDIHKNLPKLPEINDSQEKIKLSTRDIYNKYYAVKNQEILLSKYKVTAPFSGFIKSNGVIENSFVSKGQHLFTLSDAINLEISVPLLVEEINLIDISSSPTVKIYSDKNAKDFIYGKILRRETNLDRNSQTLNVYASFNNTSLNSYFLPGNYVNVKIQGKKLKNVALVPRHLLDNDGYIFTMEEPSDGAAGNKLARKKVEVVTIQGNKAVIRNTLPENTTLVTTIMQKPLVGMQIQSTDKIVESEGEKNGTIELSTSD